MAYLNPKRAAALRIAKEVMAQSRRGQTEYEDRLKLLKNKDGDLYKKVLEELGKYGFRVPGNS